MRTLNYLLIALGATLSAIGTNMFLRPSQLVTGGLSGLLLIANYFWHAPVGAMYALLNVPLAYWMYRLNGWTGVAKTFVGFMAYSVAFDATAFLAGRAPTHDPMLAVFYGGLMSGVGSWIVFQAGGSTGGTGSLFAILQQIKGWTLHRWLFVTDIVIMGLAGMAFHAPEKALYSWIMSFITTTVLERLTYNLRSSKALRICSERSQAISDALMTRLHRGTTLYQAIGGFTDKPTQITECIVAPGEVQTAMQLVIEIDPKAFVTVYDVADVQGRGFSEDTTHHRIPSWKKRNVTA